MRNDRDRTWIEMHDKKALDLMQGWTGGTDDPLYAISSTGGKNYAWVFEDAIANLDADIASVKKSGKKYKLGKGVFTKAEIDELHYIRKALADALEGARGEGDMDEFTYAYFETALWSSNDESTPEGGEPLDENYGIGDFAPETRKEMIADAKDFQKRFGRLIESAGGDWGQAGHDFWLTRNEHGVGFWDGDWPEPQATELSDAARSYGECSLYVGDDGLIYGYGCGRSPRARAEAPRRRGPRRPSREGRYPKPPRPAPGPFVTPRARGRGRRASPQASARRQRRPVVIYLEDLVFHTPPRLQGPMIEVSYASDENGVVRRTVDRSDRTTSYEWASWDDFHGPFEPWNEEPPGAARAEWRPAEPSRRRGGA